MQSALADFKAANVTEIRSLCGAGLSRSNAVSRRRRSTTRLGRWGGG